MTASQHSVETMRRLLTHLVQTNFLAFAERAFQTLNPGIRFVTGEHLMAMGYALGQVENGACRRLLVTMPPRHLKSHMISVAWPAWLLARRPVLRLITASYGLDLSHSFSAASRRVMEADWFRAAYPNTLDARANARDEIRTRKLGSRFATSVGGPLTGRGGDILILDDPLSADDAYSSTSRERVWEWFSGALMSRLNDPRTGAIVVVSQRLHTEDLPGRLLEAGGWTHLSLPAIAVTAQSTPIGEGCDWNRAPGELLHPARIGLGEITRLKQELSSEVWEAQYLQRPAPPGGSIFKLAELKRFDVRTVNLMALEAIVVSVDTALSTSDRADYTAATVWGVRGEHVHLLHAERGRLSFNEQVALVEGLSASYSARRVLIEGAGSGHLLIEELRRRRHEHIVNYNPRDDKIARAHAVTAKMKAGKVFVPEAAPWLDGFLTEVAAFPNGRNDDWVDSMTQFLRALDYGRHKLGLAA